MTSLSIDPPPAEWPALAAQRPPGRLGGADLASWRRRLRRELGLPDDRPIVATGHQTLLWHPGILVKYLAVDAVTAADDRFAAANLIVDQHADAFGAFDVPLRGAEGRLEARPVLLTRARPGVPMAHHPAFDPQPPPELPGALPSVADGVRRIFSAVAAHRDAPDAAVQMAAALDDLKARWVRPAPGVTSSDLMKTGLARALLERMVEDPRRCAAAYNAAVEAVPEGGVPPLEVGPDAVELPLWKLDPGGRRRRATADDARRSLDDDAAPPLLPRALLLTLLVRLGLCDLFVHGTGGARYDRAMEHWAAGWLDLEPAPVAVATATLRLPLGRRGESDLTVAEATRAWRRLWHDPETAGGSASPGPRKRRLLETVAAAPRRTARRRASFFGLHEALEALRREHGDALRAARRDLDDARRRAAEAPVRDRRDWAFPLYPPEMIDELDAAVRALVSGTERAAPPPVHR